MQSSKYQDDLEIEKSQCEHLKKLRMQHTVMLPNHLDNLGTSERKKEREEG